MKSMKSSIIVFKKFPLHGMKQQYNFCTCLLQLIFTLNVLPTQLVEALEVMILAILSAALKCEWDLSSVEEATITMVTTCINQIIQYN